MAEAAVQVRESLVDDIPVADLGTVSIRVIVLPPKQKKGAASGPDRALPLDLEEGEDFLLDKAATPLGSYLEHSKGKRCVVFLVNGQRQESLDNSFIVELGFKYLRNRMMIVIDVDGLTPEAIGKMMQGSRQGFYRGDIWNAMIKRVVASLKKDPDLKRPKSRCQNSRPATKRSSRRSIS